MSFYLMWCWSGLGLVCKSSFLYMHRNTMLLRFHLLAPHKKMKKSFFIKTTGACVARNVFCTYWLHIFLYSFLKFHIFIHCDEPDLRFIAMFICKSTWLFCLSKDHEFVILSCLLRKQCSFYYQIVSFGGSTVSTHMYEINLQNIIANHIGPNELHCFVSKRQTSFNARRWTASAPILLSAAVDGVETLTNFLSITWHKSKQKWLYLYVVGLL
jgi:hypothetical protein